MAKSCANITNNNYYNSNSNSDSDSDSDNSNATMEEKYIYFRC